MQTQAEIEKRLVNMLSFEQSAADSYHILRFRLAIQKRPWYEHALQAASRTYFDTKARRRVLEQVLEREQQEETEAYYMSMDEVPLPPGLPAEPDERFNQRLGEEYKPWRQLVYEYNNSPERAGCPPLTRKAFYEYCLQDSAFQFRWTPYADLKNTPCGPIDEVDLDETSGPPIS